MKRSVLSLLALCAACAALAQAPGQVDEGAQKPEKIKGPTLGGVAVDPEELEIEKGIVDRVTNQQDSWFHDGDFPAVIAGLRYQVEAWPFDEDTVTNLGWMLGNIEKKDEEIAVYMRFLKGNPTNPNAPYPAANYYFQKKDYVMAVHFLAPTLGAAVKPHPNSYRLLAHGYQRLGFLNASLKIWDMYLALAPNDAAALINRNRVAALLGKPTVKTGG